MGQKVHPIGMRLGIVKNWDSRWLAERKEYSDQLAEDIRIRNFIEDRLRHAAVSKVVIERPARNARISIYTARPGMVIGKKGEDIEKLRRAVQKLSSEQIHINIEEIRKPETEAMLVAENVAQQLERRVSFRRAMKRAVGNAMRLGAQGIKISAGGRLGGAEIARTEWYREGRVPLHTLRADIDYGLAEAKTTYGVIGVKVWIFKGEVLEEQETSASTSAQAQAG
ncbi:30S ribosomal protein S3 [Thiohalorhabdus denitrificans]|uniref:Small ribosomal subunit protein uS3 n=1 Tax=Thiohalorhabdus denitrificans TaxID=381306 RepID=A0A0P9CDQ2_9GAMM|nr:30S ribosomal protein S3 [Thiohalorhabdus denitrificans]KPV40960.1 30S ribosomal protein S3 [Thiohalorhabdus denitrificans]SCY43290.1 SSU ribosomal protein S3P [Thiohalorhabdus denitrificans]